MEEVGALDRCEREAELVLAELQSQGKQKPWSQIKDLKRRLRTDRQRDMKRGRRSQLTVNQLKGDQSAEAKDRVHVAHHVFSS